MKYTKANPLLQEKVPVHEFPFPFPDTSPCSTSGGSQKPFQKIHLIVILVLVQSVTNIFQYLIRIYSDIHSC